MLGANPNPLKYMVQRRVRIAESLACARYGRGTMKILLRLAPAFIRSERLRLTYQRRAEKCRGYEAVPNSQSRQGVAEWQRRLRSRR